VNKKITEEELRRLKNDVATNKDSGLMGRLSSKYNIPFGCPINLDTGEFLYEENRKK